MMTPLFRIRRSFVRPNLQISASVLRHWGAVGFGLTRNDEDGTAHLQLGIATLFVSSDAWAWNAPRGFDEWRVSADIYSGQLWLYGGRVPYARGEKDWPRAVRLPWFEWTYISQAKVKTPHGTHPYTYQWRYQPERVQHVTATVTEERWSWQLRFAGLPLPFRRTRRSLWAEFSEELGSERGSWKGGVTGAGFDLKPNESWQDGLCRMQTELTFCRR